MRERQRTNFEQGENNASKFWWYSFSCCSERQNKSFGMQMPFLQHFQLWQKGKDLKKQSSKSDQMVHQNFHRSFLQRGKILYLKIKPPMVVCMRCPPLSQTLEHLVPSWLHCLGHLGMSLPKKSISRGGAEGA